ncbi:hypothetical protein OF001_U50044 [Pseudomonas sp. OF001]|nr:hypothetical protein OF001_U50044 [Pseudomonas sp. OF001]
MTVVQSGRIRTRRRCCAADEEAGSGGPHGVRGASGAQRARV